MQAGQIRVIVAVTMASTLTYQDRVLCTLLSQSPDITEHPSHSEKEAHSTPGILTSPERPQDTKSWEDVMEVQTKIWGSLSVSIH